MNAARGGTVTVNVLCEHETVDGDWCEYEVEGTADVDPADPAVGLGACVTRWPAPSPTVCPSCGEPLSDRARATCREAMRWAVERTLDPTADWRVW